MNLQLIKVFSKRSKLGTDKYYVWCESQSSGAHDALTHEEALKTIRKGLKAGPKVWDSRCRVEVAENYSLAKIISEVV